MMERILSLKPTTEILALFAKIKEIEGHPNNDRVSVVKRAMEACSTNIDWKIISKERIINKQINQKGIAPPALMKISVDQELYMNISNQIRTTFCIERVTQPFFIKLILINYLMLLKANTAPQNTTNESSFLELITIFIDMLKSGEGEELNSIKKILLDWKNGGEKIEK